MKAIIICGGQATRMQGVLDENEPKALLRLEHGTLTGLIIQNLRVMGINDIYLSVGLLKEKIMDYFGDSVHYLQEPYPMGTGGWMNLINPQEFDEPFFVINGDCLLEFDARKMMAFHRAKNAGATIAVTKVKNASDYGTILIEGDEAIGFMEKTNPGQGWVNTGYYIIDSPSTNFFRDKKIISMEKDFFPLLAKNNLLFAYKNSGRWHDVGTPERYKKAYDWKVI